MSLSLHVYVTVCIALYVTVTVCIALYVYVTVCIALYITVTVERGIVPHRRWMEYMSEKVVAVCGVVLCCNVSLCSVHAIVLLLSWVPLKGEVALQYASRMFRFAGRTRVPNHLDAVTLFKQHSNTTVTPLQHNCNTTATPTVTPLQHQCNTTVTPVQHHSNTTVTPL
jgi:hypothetical protein